MEILKQIETALTGKENVIFFEIGSNDCKDTKLICDILRRTTKSFKYYCFELVTELCKWSESIMKDYPEVKIFNLAISDKCEKDKLFYFSSNKNYNGSSSIKGPKQATEIWPELTFTHSKCDTISIDEFCKANNINHIDFIWADTQGAEDLMIKGANSMISKIGYIYTEYNKNLYDGALDISEIIKLLPKFEIVEDYGGDALLKNKLY
jgi:FkbM family methyltransferase